MQVTQQGFYQKIIEKLEQESLGNTKCYVIEYQDSKVYGEPPRLYIKIEFSTARHTQITSLVRCLIHGDNLYIALDSYILGDLNIVPLVIQTFISLALLYGATVLLPIWLPALIYLYFTWIDVFRATRQKSDFVYALRCKFNKTRDLGSFNTDDTLMFLKSVSPIVTSSIKEVFEENDVYIEGLEAQLQRIEEKTSGQTFSLTAENMDLRGVVLGGSRNQAISQ